MVGAVTQVDPCITCSVTLLFDVKFRPRSRSSGAPKRSKVVACLFESPVIGVKEARDTPLWFVWICWEIEMRL